MSSRLMKWIMSSPPAEWALSQIRELLIGALRRGPIPRHVAFVMDGNRRYARNHRIETVEGHNLGFEALARVGSDSTMADRSLLTKLTIHPSRSSKYAHNLEYNTSPSQP